MFKKGHLFYPWQSKTETGDTFVFKKTIIRPQFSTTTDFLPKAAHLNYSSSVMILRPKREPAETEPTWRSEAEQHTSGMRLVDNQNMVAMFNEVLLHVKGDIPCTKAKFDILRTEKWSLRWKYTCKCLQAFKRALLFPTFFCCSYFSLLFLKCSTIPTFS